VKQLRQAIAQGTAHALVWAVKLYRLVVSPLIPPRCRYLPSCSEYCIEALQRHGPVRGAYYGVKRILRCHPWGASGLDPVP
jgi:putative membrane protein insertion efficiency factor